LDIPSYGTIQNLDLRTEGSQELPITKES